jgi:pimeloyl-ACP methyl ester carboxylesterase
MSENPTDIEFQSDGVVCRGKYVNTPNDHLSKGGQTPCVIMAHGFAGTIDMGLEPYARHFAEAGMNVALFDYRHFGLSDGTPRQLLSIRRQLRDWAAAIDHVRGMAGIDPDRIALFGTSFSGGHVVEIAARDRKIAAVISQCPMMDGFAALRNYSGYAGFGSLIKLSLAGGYDMARGLLGMKPFRLPVVGKPGTLAAMATPDAMEGVMAIAPAEFRNEVCARILLSIGFYVPRRKAKGLSCPILVLICEKDSVAPADAARKAVRQAGSPAEMRTYPIGHFDIYVGDNFERAVSSQVSFLTKHLAKEGFKDGKRKNAGL